MTPLTKEKLEEIVRSGDFNQLIGHYENDWFDVKSEPYKLENARGQRDLAADVASFANVEGGYIFIGAQGKKDESHSGEQIRKISTLKANSINIEQYRNIIEEWIFPAIEKKNVNFYQSKEDTTEGVVLIEIPSQPNSLKPFLIKNVLDAPEEGKVRKIEIMFGLVQRIGDKTDHYDVRDIHRLIQQGQNYERNIRGEFDSLKLMIEKGLSKPSVDESESHKKKVEEKIQTTLIKTNQLQERNLVLAGYIEGNGRIKNFNSSDKIKNLFTNYQQPLRNGGWKLLYSTNFRTASTDLIDVGHESNNLSLYADGTAVYVRKLDQISLVNNLSLIITIALVETVYQFADFYKQFINHLEGDIKDIVIRVELNNLINDGMETKLPFDLRVGNYYNIDLPALNISMKEQLDENKDFDSATLAFRILKVIYQWFGFNENPPYTINENSVDKIDIGAITRL